MLAYISGKIVQIVQPLIVEAGAPYPADLRDIGASSRSDRRLDIALDRKYIALLNIIALAHAVHAVFGAVHFRSAPKHLFPDIQYLI